MRKMNGQLKLEFSRKNENFEFEAYYDLYDLKINAIVLKLEKKPLGKVNFQ